MKLYFEYGDVTRKFSEYVQAQCISEDCAMGGGVVIAYRKFFPDLKNKCIAYMGWINQKRTGQNNNRYLTPNGIPLPYKHQDNNGNILYNMFTKKHVYMHCGYGISEEQYLENLKQSLEYIRDDMVESGKNKLAIPKIGCGRDYCRWGEVEKTLRKVFEPTDIEICVCEYSEI